MHRMPTFLPKTLLLQLVCLLPFAAITQTPGAPENLRCEHLTAPLGIDNAHPRLSWKQYSIGWIKQQTAYQIAVGIDSVAVSNGRGSYWSTEKINDDAQLVIYQGKALIPFTKYYWSVRIWDENQTASNWSAVSTFETGMMDVHNWQGAWISDSRDIQEKVAPYFRKEFTTSKKIVKARAYIAAGGLYELSINGHQIVTHLNPTYTRFDRRILYVTHDVTPYMQNGENAIGVLLGNGWYNHQSTAVWDFHKAPWRDRPAFCLDLHLTYTDGTKEVITSGKDWKTAHSPVIFNSIYTGEHFDARLEHPGWNTPGFDDANWKSVIYRAAPAQNIVAQVLYPIGIGQGFPAQNMQQFNDSTYVFDIGANIAGISSLRIVGEKGTCVRLKHGERLDSNGRVDQSNIDLHYRPTDDSDPFQTDIYILKGEGLETFAPKFNYKGFRYVEITGDRPITLYPESLQGLFLHSMVPAVGNISTSNHLISQIWQATNNSYLANLYGYPTDCPQREKNGWTGDAHIASETGLYNFDGITIYEKWMADHRDEQQPNGVLPAIIPTSGWGYEWANGPDWTSTIAIIPWNIYLFYGDIKILADCYDNIKRYVDHIDEMSPTGLTSWGLGDWVPVKSKTPVEFTSSAYFYVDANILAKTAKILGKEQDHAYYSALANKIKKAFNEKYLDADTGIYGSGLQTELSVPLQWHLVPKAQIKKVADNLAKRVREDNNHIDVGLLGTKAILNALSENGHAQLAYQVATQETYPSWGWWVVKGANTLYENWDIDASSDISLNHIMFGEISAWFYKALGGLKPDPEQPGFKHFILEPHLVEGLHRFEIRYQSPYGIILSSWQKESNRWKYRVWVPSNSTATVRLSVHPDQKIMMDGKPQQVDGGMLVKSLPAGQYLFEWIAGTAVEK